MPNQINCVLVGNHTQNLIAKVGSTIDAETKFGSSVAVELAGLVWRMYDVIFSVFD